MSDLVSGKEAQRLAVAHTEQCLKQLLRSLESVQTQRRASSGKQGQRPTIPVVRAQGEVIGLQVAIDAIKRRLR